MLCFQLPIRVSLLLNSSFITTYLDPWPGSYCKFHLGFHVCVHIQKHQVVHHLHSSLHCRSRSHSEQTGMLMATPPYAWCWYDLSTKYWKWSDQGWHSCSSACHRPFISFNLSLYTCPLGCAWIQWSKNIPWKIIDNVPFLSTKLSEYRVTCSKLARELANRSKL